MGLENLTVLVSVFGQGHAERLNPLLSAYYRLQV
jgi:hypothetical protein